MKNESLKKKLVLCLGGRIRQVLKEKNPYNMYNINRLSSLFLDNTCLLKNFDFNISVFSF